LNLIRFRLGWFTVAQGFAAVSRRFDVAIRPVISDDGRLAIDGDDERSLAMIDEIMARDGLA
jgi:hypothetical protein